MDEGIRDEVGLGGGGDDDGSGNVNSVSSGHHLISFCKQYVVWNKYASHKTKQRSVLGVCSCLA
jgi:hypothetical protein